MMNRELKVDTCASRYTFVAESTYFYNIISHDLMHVIKAPMQSLFTECLIMSVCLFKENNSKIYFFSIYFAEPPLAFEMLGLILWALENKCNYIYIHSPDWLKG
jgi:hypothetical protein